MAVAMKDLEIRGAGNLLGGEQSGHIAGVGFDLYVRMVGEAVAAFRGEPDTAPAEVTLELPVDAHLPTDYIAHERLRLEAYRKIADATTDEALDEVRAELVDRYGAPPAPVEALLEVATFRNLARRAGLTDVTAQGKFIRLRAGGAAGVGGPAAAPAAPGLGPQAGGADGPGAVPDHGARRRAGRWPGSQLLAWLTDLVQQVLTRQPA